MVSKSSANKLSEDTLQAVEDALNADFERPTPDPLEELDSELRAATSADVKRRPGETSGLGGTLRPENDGAYVQRGAQPRPAAPALQNTSWFGCAETLSGSPCSCTQSKLPSHA